MDDLPPTQKASRDLADAVLSDPETRRWLERMAAETAGRQPARDDFAWLDAEMQARSRQRR